MFVPLGLTGPEATQQEEDELPTSLQEDMSLLLSGLRQFRSNLKPSDQRTFDDMWALDSGGSFISNTDGLSAFDKMRARLGLVSSSVHQTVMLDLWKVRKELRTELKRFSTMKDDKEKGLRLMFLFQKDLLPGVNAMILEAKGKKDFIAEKDKVELYSKVLAWMFIIGVNCSLIFYIYLFTLRQSSERQEAWFQSFVIWIALEVFVMSTAVVYITNILLPMLTMRDLQRVKHRLKRTIRDYLADVHSHTGKSSRGKKLKGGAAVSPFNVAEFFFVSHRVAALLPSLREGEIIKKFSSPWPHQSYKRTSSLSKRYRKRFATIASSASMILVFFLKSFLSIPSAAQEGLTNIVTLVIFGNVLSVIIQLYNINPILSILPFLILVLLVHFFVKAFTSTPISADAKVLPPIAPIIVDKETDHKADSSEREEIRQAVPTRRQSIVEGVTVVRELHDGHNARMESFWDVSDDESNNGDVSAWQLPSIPECPSEQRLNEPYESAAIAEQEAFQRFLAEGFSDDEEILDGPGAVDSSEAEVTAPFNQDAGTADPVAVDNDATRQAAFELFLAQDFSFSGEVDGLSEYGDNATREAD